jgi:hypothetical protein
MPKKKKPRGSKLEFRKRPAVKLAVIRKRFRL